MRKLLKDFAHDRIAQFEIIDEKTHQYIETLPREEAVRKYGDWEVWGSYTDGFVNGGFKIAVWLWRKNTGK